MAGFKVRSKWVPVAAVIVAIPAVAWTASPVDRPGSLPAPTLEELNTLASRLGRPPVTRLPWLTEDGQDAYAVRRANPPAADEVMALD